MIRYFRAFSQTEDLRSNQTELLKAFIFLYFIRFVGDHKIEVDGAKLSLNGNQIRAVFLILGIACIIHLLRWARQFLIFSSAEATILREEAQLVRSGGGSESKAASLDQSSPLGRIIFGADIDVLSSAAKSRALSVFINGLDLLVPAALSIMSFWFAYFG